MNKSFLCLMFACLFATFLLASPGCKRGRAKPEGMPDLYPCSVTLTQEGKPLEGANVILYSTSPNFKWAVGGISDSTGLVVLRTNGFYDGVPEGAYKVTLTKILSEGPPPPSVESLPEDEMERSKILREHAKKVTNYSVIPDEYQSQNTTSLEFEVTKGNNEKTFDLGKEVKKTIVITD